MTDHFDLGRLLGRQEAFGAVASRCTAAQVDALREIKEKKLFLGNAANWTEFCLQHLHCSRENADRLIRLLNEFGPGYFEISQLMRIKPETYRAISPAIRDHALHYNGEAIALIPENAETVSKAVAEMRPAGKKKAAAEPKLPLEKRCIDFVLEVQSASQDAARHDEVWKSIVYVRERLGAILIGL